MLVDFADTAKVAAALEGIDVVLSAITFSAITEAQVPLAEAAKQAGRGKETTEFSIFVLHNKDKEKKGHLPKEMTDEKRYLAAVTVGDVWINYPWEATYVVLESEVSGSNTDKLAGTSTSTTRWRSSRRSNRLT